jgi:hypothetical protein
MHCDPVPGRVYVQDAYGTVTDYVRATKVFQEFFTTAELEELAGMDYYGMYRVLHSVILLAQRQKAA